MQFPKLLPFHPNIQTSPIIYRGILKTWPTCDISPALNFEQPETSQRYLPTLRMVQKHLVKYLAHFDPSRTHVTSVLIGKDHVLAPKQGSIRFLASSNALVSSSDALLVASRCPGPNILCRPLSMSPIPPFARSIEVPHPPTTHMPEAGLGGAHCHAQWSASKVVCPGIPGSSWQLAWQHAWRMPSAQHSE